MERELLSAVVQTDYGQFDLVWSDTGLRFDGDWARFFAGQANGLVGGADPEGVYVNLARRSGGSPVRVMLLDAPAPPASDVWEDVVEVSTSVPPGGVPRWTSWADESGGPLDAIAPGTYRLRVSARGRDQGRADEVAEGPVDDYLIELWPAPWAPDTVVRVGSEDARYWHQEIGGRQ